MIAKFIEWLFFPRKDWECFHVSEDNELCCLLDGHSGKCQTEDGKEF